jgi:hypothetical protein
MAEVKSQFELRQVVPLKDPISKSRNLRRSDGVVHLPVHRPSGKPRATWIKKDGQLRMVWTTDSVG